MTDHELTQALIGLAIGTVFILAMVVIATVRGWK